MVDRLFNNWTFFCWSCLLFSAEKGIWNGAGFNDINNFHKASGRHEKTQEPPPRYHGIKTFGFITIDTQLVEQRRHDIDIHNEKM
jgi:hypothetical protein